MPCRYKIPTNIMQTKDPSRFCPSPILCPTTAGCSPPIVFCLLLSCFTFHLGFVHPLQDVALHQCLPLSSDFCFPDPGGSFLVFSTCHLLLGRPLDVFPPLVAALVSVWSTYCPSFLLCVRPISTFVSVCIPWCQTSLFFFLISEHGIL